MLENLKLLLGITGIEEDDLLELLIQMATSDFEAMTHANPLANETIVTRMAQVRYKKRGREDIVSESFSGASTTYSETYPTDLLKVIDSKRQVVIC